MRKRLNHGEEKETYSGKSERCLTTEGIKSKTREMGKTLNRREHKERRKGRLGAYQKVKPSVVAVLSVIDRLAACRLFSGVQADWR